MDISNLKINDTFIQKNGNKCIVTFVKGVKNHPFNTWVVYLDTSDNESYSFPYYNNGRLFSFCESKRDIVEIKNNPMDKLSSILASFEQIPNQKSDINHE